MIVFLFGFIFDFLCSFFTVSTTTFSSIRFYLFKDFFGSRQCAKFKKFAFYLNFDFWYENCTSFRIVEFGDVNP